MGNKHSGGGKVPHKKANELTKKDYEFFTKHTGMSKEDIERIFHEFNSNNPDGLLDINKFVHLYTHLRPEKTENLEEISHHVFRVFDADNNGQITFSEFLLAYAMTSRGDQRHKLEYAFDLYDADRNGSLSRADLNSVLRGMLHLLVRGASQRGHDVDFIVNAAASKLDTNFDGRIGKDEFINGLLEDYALRSLMSPFN